jgi:hypothetical protein
MIDKMYRYNAYGLGLQSSLELPELAPGAATIEVTIRLGPIDPALSKMGSGPYWSWADAGQAVLYWEQVGTFLVRGATEIVIEPEPAAPEARLRLFLLGAALGYLLHQRGFTILHASAVAIEGRAVAFLGEKGWGKSTMAATLHALGHDLIADDVLAIEPARAGFWVRSAFPQLKLWPDALALIGRVAEGLPRLNPDFEKRDYRLNETLIETPLPFSHFYFLNIGSGPVIEPVPAQQALLQLLPHWYCGRFSPPVQAHLGPATRLQQCANLLRQVPGYRLTRPRSLAALAEVAHQVRDHTVSLS